MKRIISIILLSCTLLLGGCVHRMQTFKDLPSFKNGTKSIVITRNYEASKRARYCNVESMWLHNESNRIFMSHNCALPGFLDLGCSDPGSKFSVYFVEPGFYSLHDVEIDGCWTSKRYARSLNDVAAFQVKAGEVVYIGDLVYVDSGSHTLALSIKIEDHYEAAKLYFQRHYPEITHSPIKKLIRFSNRVNYTKRMLLEYGSLM